jgi:hypothetical protein
MGRATEDLLLLRLIDHGVEFPEPCRSLGDEVVEKVHDGCGTEILDQWPHGMKDLGLQG